MRRIISRNTLCCRRLRHQHRRLSRPGWLSRFAAAAQLGSLRQPAAAAGNERVVYLAAFDPQLGSREQSREPVHRQRERDRHQEPTLVFGQLGQRRWLICCFNCCQRSKVGHSSFLPVSSSWTWIKNAEVLFEAKAPREGWTARLWKGRKE